MGLLTPRLLEAIRGRACLLYALGDVRSLSDIDYATRLTVLALL